MSIFSNLIKDVAPVVATAASFTGNVPLAIAANAKVAADQRAAARFQQAKQQEALQMAAQYPGGFDPVTGMTSTINTTTAQAGNRGFVGTVTDFFSGAGEVVKSAFSSGIPQLLGFNRPRGVAQQPAITTTTNIGAQESQGSGSIQAGVGSLLPGLVGAGRALLRSPIGQTALGGGAAVGLGMLGSDGKPMRVTRKMKSQARMLLNMTGGNLQVTADMLGISEQELVFILLKRFRNDGPVVTKAALRKTKSTIRKLKNMCDMYDDLRPAARRRTPMRRAKTSTTLIKN